MTHLKKCGTSCLILRKIWTVAVLHGVVFVRSKVLTNAVRVALVLRAVVGRHLVQVGSVGVRRIDDLLHQLKKAILKSSLLNHKNRSLLAGVPNQIKNMSHGALALPLILPNLTILLKLEMLLVMILVWKLMFLQLAQVKKHKSWQKNLTPLLMRLARQYATKKRLPKTL